MATCEFPLCKLKTLKHTLAFHFITYVRCPHCTLYFAPDDFPAHSLTHGHGKYTIPPEVRGKCSECFELFNYADFTNHQCKVPPEESAQRYRVHESITNLHTALTVHPLANQSRETMRRLDTLQWDLHTTQKRAEQAEDRAEQAKNRAEQAEDRAEQAKNRAEQAKDQAEQAKNRAEQANNRAEQAENRAETLQEEVRTLQNTMATLSASVAQLYSPFLIPVVDYREGMTS